MDPYLLSIYFRGKSWIQIHLKNKRFDSDPLHQDTNPASFKKLLRKAYIYLPGQNREEFGCQIHFLFSGYEARPAKEVHATQPAVSYRREYIQV